MNDYTGLSDKGSPFILPERFPVIRMMPHNLISSFANDGYAILEGLYSEQDIRQLITLIERTDNTSDAVRKSSEIFAIRRFLHTIPEAQTLILNHKFRQLLKTIGGNDYFIIKGIYFDKPAESNWFVPYHQDLTIAVDRKMESEGFINPTVKHGQHAVQPPVTFLESTITFRIHLDDTTADNGALYVIPGSHSSGIRRADVIQQDIGKETCCPVKRGGIMLMKPLLFHRSFRSNGTSRRRVIHIECCNLSLPGEAQWSEQLLL